MNMQLLRQNTENVITALTTALAEAEQIEAKRTAFENSQLVSTQREQRLNARENEQKKRGDDLDAQKQYIDEQVTSNQATLNKILLEKKALAELATEKREIEQERLQLATDKKSFETQRSEKEKFLLDKEEFAKERQLFAKEKLALIESEKLLSMREANIKIKEERQNRIERMTQV